MSIVESLRKLVDPVAARAAEHERKTLREQPKREAVGDPPRFRCRVCAREDLQGAYCPNCLADTMKRAPSRAPDDAGTAENDKTPTNR